MKWSILLKWLISIFAAISCVRFCLADHQDVEPKENSPSLHVDGKKFQNDTIYEDDVSVVVSSSDRIVPVVDDEKFLRRDRLLNPTEEAVRAFIKRNVLVDSPDVQSSDIRNLSSLEGELNLRSDNAVLSENVTSHASERDDVGQLSEGAANLNLVVEVPLSSNNLYPDVSVTVEDVEENVSSSSEKLLSPARVKDAADTVSTSSDDDAASGVKVASGNDSQLDESQDDVLVASSSVEMPVEAFIPGVDDVVRPLPLVTVQDLDPTHSILESGGPTATDDMPSFNEWTRKRLEEQGHHQFQLSSGHLQKVSTAMKKRHKNYASVDCGAKVLATNPEAQSSSAILSHDQDDYMLSPCTARIWFVVELCESIQVDRLELANYELFSSSPKQFAVSSSDRYPTRDWNVLGTFEALDEKTVQGFSLHQTAFSKYVKVEMVNHFGAEHFCPLSLVRVYGTSEYEALETEEQDAAASHILQTDDEDLSVDLGPEPTNLFGSAKDAVMTIVKKAAEVLRPGERLAVLDSGVDVTSSFENESERNCICLQRLRYADCQVQSGPEHNLSLAKMSLSYLQCNYRELVDLLRHLSFLRNEKQQFLNVCSRQCSLYLNEDRDEGRSSKECEYVHAMLGPLRFGALCHLDKLQADQLKGVPVEESKCPAVTLFSDSEILLVKDPKSSSVPVSTSEFVSVTLETRSSVVSPPPPFFGSGLTTQSMAPGATDITDGFSVIMTSRPVTMVLGSSSAAISPSEIRPTRTVRLNEANANTVEGDAETLQGTGGFASDEPVGASASIDTEQVLLSAAVSDGVSKARNAGSILESLSFLDGGGSVSLETITVKAAASEPQATLKTLLSSSIASLSSHEGFESAAAKDEEAEVANGGAAAVAGMPPLDALSESLGVDLDKFIEEENLSLPPGSSSMQPDATSNMMGDKPGGGGGFVGGGGNVPFAPGQKESVFVRLSNRIKALELNMSLSGQYLEELSRRYRKQMEEMQKAFNKTISALNETARKAHEQDLKQQEMISLLQVQLDDLSKVVVQMADQQESLNMQIVARHLILMMVEAIVLMALFLACSRTSQSLDVRQQLLGPILARPSSSTSLETDREKDGGTVKGQTVMRAIAGRPPQRRSSDPNLSSLSPSMSLSERRRPSSEALNVSGSYSDLLIVEPTVPNWMDRASSQRNSDQGKKGKRKKQKNKTQEKKDVGLYRSLSNSALPSRPPPCPRQPTRKSSTVNSAGVLFATSSSERSRIENLLPASNNVHGSKTGDGRRHRGELKLSRQNSSGGEKRSSPPSPPLPLKRPRANGKSDCPASNASSSSARCLPNFSLSCCQPFIFKETSLETTASFGGCDPPIFGAQETSTQQRRRRFCLQES